MSTERSIFVTAPDMTPEAWAAELAGTRIAAEARPEVLYNLVSFSPHPDEKRTLSHAFMLALCFTEHRYAADATSIEEKYRTNSWGMRRSLADKEINDTSIITTPRGKFVKYPNWEHSLDDCCFALTDEGFVYQQEHRETIRAVIERWSPAGDFDNAPERRMATIATMMDRLAAPAPPQQAQGGTMAPRIAIASGHHNSSGGDEFEKSQTGPLCAAVAKHCRALGMDVRVVQPDDGMGTIAGSLDVVGNTVVKWANEGWRPDIFLECHTEGGGGTGVFAIYPDSPGDVDTDVQEDLGPMVSKAIALATGLKLGAGGDGIMSEKQTGVGASGSRLGIFRTTVPIKEMSSRLIIEYGAHDKEPDLSIAKGANFAERAGRATAGAFAEFLGWTPPLAANTTGTSTAAGDAVLVTPFISEQGHACVTIDFGGTVTKILGVNAADIGISGIGTDGGTYDRSVQQNVGKPWTKRIA